MVYKREMIINEKKAYFFESNVIGENFNFHDYIIPDYKPHLVIENGWDDNFFTLIDGKKVEAISLISCYDLFFLPIYFNEIKSLTINGESIKNFDPITKLNSLEDFALICSKNFSTQIEIPLNLKSLTIDWKSKFSFVNTKPKNLEFISIYDGKDIDWTYFSNSSNLMKIDLNNCNLTSGDFIFEYENLLSIVIDNCREIQFSNEIKNNKSIKYVSLTKSPINNIDWVSKLESLDILIFDSCGDINSLYPIKNIKNIRGLLISGNTNILDGNLNFLLELEKLKNCSIKPKKNYSLATIVPWNWDNFQKSSITLFRKK